MHPWWIGLLTLLLLSGCVASDPTATVVVDFADGSVEQATWQFDPDERPTAALYAAEGATHPDFYNVHDLLYEVSATGPAFTFQYFSFGDAGGFFVCSIDNRPATIGGECPQDGGGFYEFRVDGEASNVGVSDVDAEDGARYSFVWTTF